MSSPHRLSQHWPNLPEMLFAQAERLGDKDMLWVKSDGIYRSLSWAEVANRVARLARGLQSLGIEPGDRVILVSESRPEWCIADIGIMAAGAISVPAYTTNTIHDHQHIVMNSGARGAIISTAALAMKFLPAAHESDRLGFAITMEEPGLSQKLNVDIHDWDSLLAAQPDDLAGVREEVKFMSRDDLACIIYTSGTGGAPKGVMLHHGGILHNCEGAEDVIKELGIKNDRFLSFLPLSHAYEHAGGQFLPIYLGASIYYAESIDKLVANLAEARPTIMTVVPRLFEMLKVRISRGVQQQGGYRAKLFDRAVQLGSKRITDPAGLSLIERVEDIFLDLLVRSKVKKRFGGKVKALISGGAPLNPEVGLFFNALGLRLLQGYGQTETSPVVSVNRASSLRMDTVGQVLKNTEIRIASDGEILVKGELVMKGYWKDEAATAEVFDDDGWLHTGDIGTLDEDGHLRITDRKKDLIINDKGDNVSPQRIEGMLTLEPEIAQAMVYGDRRSHLVALIVPDGEWLKAWARSNDRPRNLAELQDDKEFRAAIDAAVSRVNGHLSNLEKVRRFAITDEPFTIENAQMTPKMSIRRHVISAIYQDRIEGLY